MASRSLLVLAALLVMALCAAAAAAQQKPLPPKYRTINPGKYKRDQQLTCDDPNDKKAKCLAKCDKRCPNQCVVLCPGCKTFCSTWPPPARPGMHSCFFSCMHYI